MGGSGEKGADYRRFKIKCDHCGTVFEVGYHPGTDVVWGGSDKPGVSGVLHKEAMDSRCFRRINITLEFDKNRHVFSREITGGSFVEEEKE